MKVKFSDICTITSSKRIFESEYVERGIPFIRGQEISDGSILDENAFFECYISQERYNEIKSKYYVPKLGDILITAVGTIGNLCYIDRNRDFYFKDGNVILFTSFNEGVYSKYLFYYMKSPIFKKQLEYTMIGAVQKALTMVMLNKIEIDLPNIETQKSIVEILDKIDSKILINNRINSELESMTKTIYDYWFTQFDFPDENGKPYRSSGGAMVWNKQLKRDIPADWQVTSITDNDLFQIIKPGINNFKGDKTYLATADIVGTTILNGNIINYDTRESRANMQPSLYSVWFAKMKNSIKHLNVGCKMGSIIDNYILSTGFCGLQCSKFSFEYVASFIEHSYFEVIKDTLAHGATQEAVNNDDLCNIFLLKPSDDILQLYHKQTSSIFSQISTNICENQKLSALRDWLLPMLMNGQLSIMDEQEEQPQINDSGFEQWIINQGVAARGDVDMEVLRNIYEAMDSDDK